MISFIGSDSNTILICSLLFFNRHSIAVHSNFDWINIERQKLSFLTILSLFSHQISFWPNVYVLHTRHDDDDHCRTTNQLYYKYKVKKDCAAMFFLWLYNSACFSSDLALDWFTTTNKLRLEYEVVRRRRRNYPGQVRKHSIQSVSQSAEHTLCSTAVTPHNRSRLRENHSDDGDSIQCGSDICTRKMKWIQESVA